MAGSAVSSESRYSFLEKAGFGDLGCSLPCDALPEAIAQMYMERMIKSRRCL